MGYGPMWMYGAQSAGRPVPRPVRRSRLFDGTTGTKALRLVDSRTIGDGLAFLTYRFVDAA